MARAMKNTRAVIGEHTTGVEPHPRPAARTIAARASRTSEANRRAAETAARAREATRQAEAALALLDT